jgi:hypothetical protein
MEMVRGPTPAVPPPLGGEDPAGFSESRCSVQRAPMAAPIPTATKATVFRFFPRDNRPLGLVGVRIASLNCNSGRADSCRFRPRGHVAGLQPNPVAPLASRGLPQRSACKRSDGKGAGLRRAKAPARRTGAPADRKGRTSAAGTKPTQPGGQRTAPARRRLFSAALLPPVALCQLSEHARNSPAVSSKRAPVRVLRACLSWAPSASGRTPRR